MSDFDISIAAFGAAGDGIADDTEAFETAIASCQDTGKTLHLHPGRRYSIRRELVITTDKSLRIDGHGASLIADAPMRSLLALLGGAFVQCREVTFHGGRLAEFALYSVRGGQSRFSDCVFYFGLVDSVRLAAGGLAGGNDCMQFFDCEMSRSGQAHTVTVTCPASNGSDEPVLDLGIDTSRVTAGDLLKVGDYIGQVAGVPEPGKVRMKRLPAIPALEGASGTLFCGYGYREEAYNDNNLCVLRDCTLRANGCGGALLGGLYGARLQSVQSDFNGLAGFVVGILGDVAPIGTSFRDCYSEDHVLDFLFAHANGVEISTFNGPGTMATLNPSFAYGTFLNLQGQPGLKNICPNKVVHNLIGVP